MSKSRPKSRIRAGSRPQIFIGSSSEALPLARAIQRSLRSKADCVVWDEIHWNPGYTPLEVLVEVVDSYQYGIFVYATDDFAVIRKKRFLVARDNVVLEHGLFAGQLGRKRVFFITPQVTSPPLHLPTDLQGLIHGRYDATLALTNPSDAVADFCASIREQIRLMQGQLIPSRVRGQIRETASISRAASGNAIYDTVNRIRYEPTDVTIVYDIDRRWAEMRYDIAMYGEGVDFEGPCVAKGEVHEGWAYMTYAATDRRNQRLLKGVCIVRVPADFGGVPYGYWMTHDALADNNDSISFGIGSTKRLRNVRELRRK